TFHGVRKEEAKNGRPRQVPLNEEVMALAPLLSMQSGGGKWFPFKPGGAWQLWDYIRKDMQARNLDIDDVVLHTLRHTCASRLRRRGVAIDIIQRWLGHSDISITVKRYVHTSAADLAAAAGFASNGSKAANHSTESSNGALRVPTFTENKRDKAGTAHLQ
ncbi:MAG TPA: site-specific integrase, partial [Sphingobium sp.]